MSDHTTERLEALVARFPDATGLMVDVADITNIIRELREARQENERLNRRISEHEQVQRRLVNDAYSGGIDDGRAAERADVVARMKKYAADNQHLGNIYTATEIIDSIAAILEAEHVGAATPEPAEPPIPEGYLDMTLKERAAYWREHATPCSIHECGMEECWEEHWRPGSIGLLSYEQRQIVKQEAIKQRHLLLQSGVTQLWLEKRRKEFEDSLEPMDPDEVEKLMTGEEVDPF